MITVHWHFFGRDEGGTETFETLEDFEWWYRNERNGNDVASIEADDPDLDAALERYRPHNL